MVKNGLKSEACNIHMTFKEACEYLNISHSHMRNLRKRKAIPCFKVGGELRFNRERLEQWCRDLESKEYQPNEGLRRVPKKGAAYGSVQGKQKHVPESLVRKNLLH